MTRHLSAFASATLVMSLLGFARVGHCVENLVLSVEVVANGDDAQGMRLTDRFKDLVRRSPGLILEAPQNVPHFVVHLKTIDVFPQTPDETGRETAFSYVLAFERSSGDVALVDDTIGVCGAAKIKECAEELFVRLNRYADATRESLRREFEPKSR